MRILLLTSFDIFPPLHGGSSIAYNFIKHAAARHEVSAVVSHMYSLHGEIDLINPRVRIQYCPPSPFDSLRVFSFLVNPLYWRAADRLCREQQPNVVQCESLWPILAGWQLKRRYGVPLVCVEYNVESDKFAALGRPWPVVGIAQAVERFACHRADRVVTVSEADREQLIRRYAVAPERIRTIQPSPDLSDFRFDEAGRHEVRKRFRLVGQQPLLTFVGNLRYEPNQQAVRHIAETLYPAIVAKRPDARFVIIGQGAELLSNFARPNLSFTGYLSREQLTAHLSATDVFLVPVTTGSGIRVKIPEATACGRAVVATCEAASGLEAFSEDEIVRVEGVGPQFAAAVLRLVRDPELRARIGARAHLRTLQTFGWHKTLSAYEDVYASLGLPIQELSHG
jgi:glycosyltransferase involved in cell wall biosynthesis